MPILRKNIHKNTQPPNILQRTMPHKQSKRKKKKIQHTILLQKPKKNTHQIPRNQHTIPTKEHRPRKRSRNNTKRNTQTRNKILNVLI